MNTLQKIGTGIAASALALASFAMPSFAANTYSATPWTFVGAAGDCGTGYPAGTPGGVVSMWDSSTGNPAPSLRLEKNVPTSDCSSAGVTINGVNGITLTELDFDVKGYCGAGAPRYNVSTSQGYYFFGCTSGTHTPSTTDPTWTHVEFSNADAVPAGSTPAWPGFGNVVITGIEIVQDEQGQTNLDNLSINNQIIGGPTTQQQKDSCKNNGWKTYTGLNGTPGPFKNQGDCVSYFATGGKNGPNG